MTSKVIKTGDKNIIKTAHKFALELFGMRRLYILREAGHSELYNYFNFHLKQKGAYICKLKNSKI